MSAAEATSAGAIGNAKVVKKSPLAAGDARWIKLLRVDYRDVKNHPRVWETAERASRPQGSDIDGVGIVALLEKTDGKGPDIILQKQFRPPIDKITIEIPAGLVDAGETAEQAAVRELKEETGYVGAVSETSAVMFNDPGFCNTNLRMVYLTVDPLQPENKNPQSSLEEDEFIEVFTIPLRDLHAECKKLERQGYAIDARVGTMAEGIEMAKRFRF